MTLQGICTCGRVRYEIQGTLQDLAYCHCSVCRRTLGAAFGTYARVVAERFTWVAGEDDIKGYESSPTVFRCACGTCGSPLGARAEDGSLSWVTLGTVSGDPGVRPVAHIFVGSKARWYEITDDLPQFDEWPPETSEFFARFW